jgi:glycosyltransferase involved in cell wall biosynthesis
MEYLGSDKPINKIQPLVSVCIPTYNHAAYIAECLDSVLMQETDFPFEIIIGEDDSTDGTREICKTYAEKYPNKIRLFLRDDKDKIIINGLKTGRSNNIKNFDAARGKYIALCEGDDYWIDNNKLMKQVRILDENKDIALVHSEVIGKKDNAYIDELPYKRWNKLKPRLTFYDALLKPIAFTCTAMFRNINGGAILKNSEQVLSGDWVLWLNILMSGDALFLNEKLAVYRIGVGISTKVNYRDFQGNNFNYLKTLLVKNNITLINKGLVLMFLISSSLKIRFVPLLKKVKNSLLKRNT